MSLPGGPVIHPGAGVIGEADLIEVWRSGRRKLHVNRRSLVTHQAQDAAARLGIEIIEGPPDQPTLPATDGMAAMRRVLYRSNPRWVASARPRGLNPSTFGRLVIVGAGGVGAGTAHLAANASVADEIVLIDVVPGVAEATALDLEHSVGITGSRARITGGTSLALMEGADVVVITAGRPRTPGMSRSDLAGVNARVVRQTCERLAEIASDAVVVVVTNPLDEMTTEALRTTGFPRERVMGMAGTLDSGRFRTALARAAAVDPADVEAITLGSHGDEMVPIISTATIKGRRLEEVLTAEAIQSCIKDAVTGGGQVVAIRKTGSATLAPAHATLEVLDALRGARAGAIPVSVMLRGEYGIEDVVLGVPCLLGPTGVVEIVELPLADDELAAMQAAAAAVAARIGG
ncbi:MAG: malate dehydrogenase [Acidimicrobiia bacterium]